MTVQEKSNALISLLTIDDVILTISPFCPHEEAERKMQLN